MRKKVHKTKNKIYIIPKSPWAAVLMTVTLIAEIVFMLLLSMVDVLPAKFAAVLFLLIIAVDVLMVFLLNSRKQVTHKRKGGAVIAVLMTVLFAVGCWYLYSTYHMFSNISDEDTQTEEFYVVVLKNGSFEDKEGLKGKTVYVTENGSDKYSRARDKLNERFNVSYKAEEDCLNLGHVLIDDEGRSHDRIIFLSSSNYDIVCEEIDGFEKKTKILYTVSIELRTKNIAKRIDVTKDPFNVYISGIDTFGSIDKVSRSDVNMIMTVDPKEKQILLTSIPRDMYLTLHSYGQLDKLTHSGIYGIDETVSTVEDWLGIDINYYCRVNFTSLVDIVDVIGGIDVESEYAFSSSVSDYSYVEGINHLDGRGALFFARERKSLDGGDNERVKNQQRVLKGIIQKVTGSTVILTRYTSLLDAVSDKMQTNLIDKDISALVKMQLADLGGWSIETQSVKGTGTYAPTYSMGSRELYVAVPDSDSVKAAQEQIKATAKQGKKE